MEPVKKRGNFKGYAKYAGAALLVAGAAFLICSRDKPVWVAKAEMPDAAGSVLAGRPIDYDNSRRRSFERFREMSESQMMIRQSRKKSESQMKKNTSDLLFSLAEEFPYHGFDCKLVPREKPEPHLGTYESVMAPMTPKEKSRYVSQNVSDDAEKAVDDNTDSDKTVDDDADENPIRRLLEDSKKSMGSRAIPDMIKQMVDDYTEAAKTDSFPQLSGQIDNMKDENNLDGILSVIDYMRQLNLEWEGEEGVPWAPQTLYAIYSEMRSRASMEDWELAPDHLCIMRNAYALRILHYSYEALADAMLKYPGSADNAIGRLEDRMRFMILHDYASSLLFSGDFDSRSIENFFSYLSPENKKIFLAALSSSNKTIYDEDIARLKNLVQELSDPLLRETITEAYLK